MVDTGDLKSPGLRPCRFESGRGHQDLGRSTDSPSQAHRVRGPMLDRALGGGTPAGPAQEQVVGEQPHEGHRKAKDEALADIG